jgi:hypothetical protein
LKRKLRKYVEVFYEPDLRNWDAVIKRELERRELKRGQVTVIARPLVKEIENYHKGKSNNAKLDSKLFNL